MQSLFQQFPPERIGLHGEYDHNGLAKRVQAKFNQSFSTEALRKIKVRQRGAMVVLLGTISDRALLSALVNVAMTVDGAIGVEVNGMNVVSPAFSATSHLWPPSPSRSFPTSQTVG